MLIKRVDSSLRELDASSLLKIKESVRSEAARREDWAANTYGWKFTKIVGGKRIYDLPEVEGEEIDFFNRSRPVIEDVFKGYSAMRGIAGHRPFIAMLIDVCDPKTGDVIDRMTKIIYRRFYKNELGRNCFENIFHMKDTYLEAAVIDVHSGVESSHRCSKRKRQCRKCVGADFKSISADQMHEFVRLLKGEKVVALCPLGKDDADIPCMLKMTPQKEWRREVQLKVVAVD